MEQIIAQLRHPRTYANEEKRVQGQTDSLLIPGYQERLYAIAEVLLELRIKTIVTSPLDRTRIPAEETADYMREQRLEPRLLIEPDLKERNFGDYEGQLITTLPIPKEHDPYEYLFFLKEIKNGESAHQLMKRAEKIKTEIIQGLGGNQAHFGHGTLHNHVFNYIKSGNIFEPGFKKLGHLEGLLMYLEDGAFRGSEPLVVPS